MSLWCMVTFHLHVESVSQSLWGAVQLRVLSNCVTPGRTTAIYPNDPGPSNNTAELTVTVPGATEADCRPKPTTRPPAKPPTKPTARTTTSAPVTASRSAVVVPESATATVPSGLAIGGEDLAQVPSAQESSSNVGVIAASTSGVLVVAGAATAAVVVRRRRSSTGDEPPYVAWASFTDPVGHHRVRTVWTVRR